MVAKISFGSSLYGALAYNGEKINKEEGKLLATNKIFDDCSGKTSIANALRDFQRYLSPHIRTEKPVVHISLNPHPDDVLTDMDMENIAREYLERMGYGNQPYMVYKHEDIDRHHMHIVTIQVDENGKCLDSRYNYHRSKAITSDLEEKYNLHKADRKQRQADNPLRKVDASQGNVKKQVANTVKSLCATYRFQSLGEYRALLSLYNISLEEVIDRHHMHIVTIQVDENGKCLDSRYNYHRSKAITSDLEEKYNLHKADRKQRQADNPLRKVDASQGNVKKQVANTVKSLCATYRFQSLGEYRALLSLYNISLEEVRGEVGGREYHGFVYSATDGQGNKVGNPFKASKIDKSVGVEAIEKRFAYSTKKFKEEKKLSEMTKHSVEAVLKQTYHKDKFVELLKAKGIDVVFRHTADGRIYGATFIDHRTQSVFNGSRLGTNLSANALQEHFTLPYENEQPIPLAIPKEEDSGLEQELQGSGLFDEYGSGLGLMAGNGSSNEAQEAAFDRELRRKKKKRKGRNL